MKKMTLISCLGMLLFALSPLHGAEGKTSSLETKIKPESRQVLLGGEFLLELESNPTTGYLWNIVSYDKKALTFLKKDFIPPVSELCGAPGKQRFLFRAKSISKTRIILQYSRSWEKTPPAETKVFEITVIDKLFQQKRPLPETGVNER